MSRQPSKPNTNSDNKDTSRNEYIPSFISAKPFYASDLLADTEYLSHQRSQTANEQASNSIAHAKWYSRSKTGPAATKYRKGACENCGAMTHKTKDCLSRPRKQGAKWTGRDIQADERVEDVKLGWDAKRDRWNGYDAREYDGVIKDYEDLEALRIQAESKTTNTNTDANDLSDTEGDPKDTIDGEDLNLLKSQPTSTRQLRLREDTAKYLLDLDLDSAKYDPKTRSMDTTAQTLNNNPTASTTTDLASEGFIRPSHDPASDAAAFERAQRYAWDSQDQPPSTTTTTTTTIPHPLPSSKVHLEANPTASLLSHKTHLSTLAVKKAEQQAYLLTNYGTVPSTTTPKPAITTSSSSTYIEYNPETGKPKDYVKTVTKSKYTEDVFPGNHSSVFGSYWRGGRWGFKCCWSFVRNSYCTGEEGKRGFEEEEAQRLGRNLVADVADEGGQGTGDAESDERQVRKRKADESEEGREKRARTEEVS